MINPKELWIKHYSVRSWNDPTVWDKYFRALEHLLGDRLVKLDHNDPMRRKADVASGEGKFVVQFGEREDSRTVWGRFAKTKIEFAIWYWKAGKDSYGELRDNSIRFTIPEKMASGPDAQLLIELFRLGNETLDPFYSYGEIKEFVCAKKPSTPSLDISCELPGVFWLTFFGSQYCEFFGRERLLGLKQATKGPINGVTLQLAETAGQIPAKDRIKIEQTIATQSFSGTGGEKADGQYVLTLEQLSSELTHTRP